MKNSLLSVATVIFGGLLAGNVITLLSRALMNLPEGRVAVVLNATSLTALLSLISIGVAIQVSATVNEFYSFDTYRVFSTAIGGVFIIGVIAVIVSSTFYSDGVTAVGLAITVLLASFLAGALAKRNKSEEAEPTQRGLLLVIAGSFLATSALTAPAATFPEWSNNVASGFVLTTAVAVTIGLRVGIRKSISA